MKRVFWLVAPLVLSSAAHASFEMALVGDATNHCIHRIDPVTGAYLGSFGQGRISTPSAIYADRATGSCYVYDASIGFLSQFEYSTGLLVQSRGVGGFVGTPYYQLAKLNDGTLALSVSSFGIVRYAADLNMVGSIGGSYSGLALVNGVYTTYNSSTHKYAKVDFTNINPLVTDYSNSLTLVNPGQIGSMGSSFGAQIEGAGANRLRLFDGGSIYGNVRSFATLTTLLAFGKGHGNGCYMFGTGASGATVMQRSMLNEILQGGDLDSISYSSIGTVSSMSMVVAPEPGVFAGLGLGLTALMLRRRRK